MAEGVAGGAFFYANGAYAPITKQATPGVGAVLMTAGPDEIRGSSPNHPSAHKAHDSTRVVPILGSTDFAITVIP